MTPEERIAEINDFLRFVREEWPHERSHLRSQLAKRCSICAVSERFSELHDGVCAECQRYVPASVDSTEELALARQLDALLESYQGRGTGRYDALVLFSGGKDSAFLLHLLRRKFPGLRLLAFMVDNSFTSTIALANADRVASVISDIDYITIKPKESLFGNTFRYALTHLNAGGCYSTVDRLGGDLVFDIGRNAAASLGIPLVLHGGTRAQVQQILKLSSYETPRDWEIQTRKVTGGFTLKEIYDEEELKYWWDGSAWPPERIPRVIFPYYAWPCDEATLRSEVQRLGLIETGNENPIASNSHLLPVNLATDAIHLGYSGYEPEFAQMIRENRTNKAQWLFVFESIEHLAQRGQLLPRCVADTLSRLGLTHRELGLPEPPHSAGPGG